MRAACLAACQAQQLSATCPEIERAATFWDKVCWPHAQSGLTLSLRLALLALSLIPTLHHIQEPVKGPER